MRTNYSQVGRGTPSVIGSTLTSVGELIESGSYSRALFEYLSQAGRNPQEITMLRSAKDDFVGQMSQILDSFASQAREGDAALTSLKQQNERLTRAQTIVSTITTANMLFKQKKGAELFLENQPRVYSDLHTLCSSESDFVGKIAGIGSLFEVDRTPLQRLVSAPDDLGSIALVKAWLEEQNIAYEPSMIATWKHIRTLRNARPIHPRTEGVVEAIEFFGENFPVADYGRLWDKFLDRFLQSLLAFQKTLSELP
jgi:hypothetical protein